MTCLCLDIKEGETLRINGATISFEKRTRIRLHNKVAFLLQRQTIAEEDATTPFRRAYLAVQEAYMEGDNLKQTELADAALKTLRNTVAHSPDTVFFRAAAISHLEEGRFFRTLSELRHAIKIDDATNDTAPIAELAEAELAAA